MNIVVWKKKDGHKLWKMQANFWLEVTNPQQQITKLTIQNHNRTKHSQLKTNVRWITDNLYQQMQLRLAHKSESETESESNDWTILWDNKTSLYMYPQPTNPQFVKQDTKLLCFLHIQIRTKEPQTKHQETH